MPDSRIGDRAVRGSAARRLTIGCFGHEAESRHGQGSTGGESAEQERPERQLSAWEEGPGQGSARLDEVGSAEIRVGEARETDLRCGEV